ncbi:helix-turn-helix domain-containing protein [Halobellus rufus]|uniref:helix-turn-helix domain-containing protein n=1 Tax=Halobellus rufus TaxID=1448860 RepID=UPI0031F32224
MNEFPDETRHEVLRITGVIAGQAGVLDVLTSKQRYVVETALRLGYYNRPRQLTHEDIASELDCAPSNVSTHLQLAESKLIRELFTVWTNHT